MRVRCLLRCPESKASLVPDYYTRPKSQQDRSLAFVALHLIGNLRLDELGQEGEGFLPAQITSLGWNHRWDALLNDVQFSSDGDLLQRDRRDHLAREVWVVEPISVADKFVWLQLEILAAERVAVAG